MEAGVPCLCASELLNSPQGRGFHLRLAASLLHLCPRSCRFPAHSSCELALSPGSIPPPAIPRMRLLPQTSAAAGASWLPLCPPAPSLALPFEPQTDRHPEWSFSEWNNTMSLSCFNPPRRPLWPPCCFHTRQARATLRLGPCSPLCLGYSPSDTGMAHSLALGFYLNATSSERTFWAALSFSIHGPRFIVLCNGDGVSVCVVSICTSSRMWAPWGWGLCFAHLSLLRAWIRARFSNICRMNECGDLSRKHSPLALLLFLGPHSLWSLKVLTYLSTTAWPLDQHGAKCFSSSVSDHSRYFHGLPKYKYAPRFTPYSPLTPSAFSPSSSLISVQMIPYCSLSA